jgi:hypothetical protein
VGAWGAFLDERHVLWKHRTERVLEVRSLPEQEVIHQRKLDQHERVLVTPGGDYFMIARLGHLTFFDPRTGGARGRTRLPSDTVGALRRDGAVAFSPDGKRMAVLVTLGQSAGGFYQVVVFDLQSGEIEKRFCVPKDAECLQWCGDDHLLMGKPLVYLVDLRRQSVVWRYKLENAVRSLPTHDGRCWLLSHPVGHPHYLHCAPVAAEDTLQRIEVELSDKSTRAFGRGTRVTLDIRGVRSAQMPGNFATEVETTIRRQLSDRGIGIVPDAPVKLLAGCEPGETETLVYEEGTMSRLGTLMRGRGDRSFTISCYSTHCTLSIVDEAGRPLWARRTTATTIPGWSIDVEEGQDPAVLLKEAGEKGYRDAMRRFFCEAPLPDELFHQPRDAEGEPGCGVTLVKLDQVPDVPEQHAPPGTGVAGPSRPAPPVGPSQPATAPPAGSQNVRELIRQVYVDLIADDGSAVAERLRWNPGEREPAVGLRWGVGVQWTGENAGPEIRSEQEFAQATGNVGPGIVAALKQRLAQGKFGNWPAASGSQIDHVVFLGSDDLANLLDDARRTALDRLALINLTVKTIGFQRRRDVTMTVRLVDVASGQSQWASPSLSASQMMAAMRAGGNPGAAMVAEVMKEVDAKHELKPMPALRPEHVESRVAALAEDLSDKPDQMLPVLVELRYYQAKGLLSAERAAELYDRILGTGRGRLLAGDDEAGRREALSAWLELK